MIETIENLKLINTVNNLFLAFIGIQIAGLIISFLIIIMESVLEDIFEFLEEYWDWDYILENILGISLWVGSILSYFYLRQITKDINDIKIVEALEKNTYACWYVITMISSLLLYTIGKTIKQIARTQEICDKLITIWIIRIVGKLLWFASWVISDPWGWVAKGCIHIISFWIDCVVDSKLRKAVITFLIMASVEYFIRSSIVIFSVYAVTSEFKVW